MCALIGLPAALVVLVGWPLPRQVPTLRELTAAITGPNLLTTDTLINGGAVVLWLLWAVTVVLVLLTAVSALTRLRTPRLPVPRLARRALTGLLGSITVTAGHAAVAAPPAAVAGVAPEQAPPPAERTRLATTPAITVTPAAAPTPATPPPAKATRHVVADGDTLWDIADRRLGDPHRWPEIFDLNKNHQQANGHALRDPDLIHVGWTLDLPPREPSNDRPPEPPPPRPTPPREPTPPTGSDRPPATPAPATPPEAAEITPPSASAAQTEPDQTAGPAPHAEDSGVRLTDGSWMPWTLAAAITAVAALVWLQRRRRPIPDAAPIVDLPPAVRQVRRAVNRQAPRPALTGRPGPAAEHDDVRGGPALVGGLGATGDGARAAARAALVAALASGDPDHPAARGEVIVDRATLRTLLGDASSADLTPWPRLRTVETVERAVADIETELLHRARILDEHALTDLDELRTQAPDEEALPPILLLTHAPPASSLMRTTAALTLGARLGITSFVIGPTDAAPTVEVDADGHTRLVAGTPTEPLPQRLPVLQTDTAVQILTTLREAHTGQPPPPPHHATAAAAVHGGRPTTAAVLEPAEARIAATPAAGRALLRVLGPTGIDGVTAPGRPLRAKALELAVFLACHPDGMSTRDIGEHLEPDARLSQADQRVHTNASNLRHVFGRAAGPQPNAYVIKTGGRYRLDPNTVGVDVWQLRGLLTAVATATGPRRRELLHTTCALYHGPLADGLDYEWIQPHREAVGRWAVEANLLLADDLLNDDPRAASEVLDTAIGLDRYHEPSYVKAMHVRHALRDADGIRHLHRALTRALADLDAEPHEDTTALAMRLRADLTPR